MRLMVAQSASARAPRRGEPLRWLLRIQYIPTGSERTQPRRATLSRAQSRLSASPLFATQFASHVYVVAADCVPIPNVADNVMVGVAHAQEVYELERVAVLDFDVHHGNGGENITFCDPTRLCIASGIQTQAAAPVQA